MSRDEESLGITAGSPSPRGEESFGIKYSWFFKFPHKESDKDLILSVLRPLATFSISLCLIFVSSVLLGLRFNSVLSVGS